MQETLSASGWGNEKEKKRKTPEKNETVPFVDPVCCSTCLPEEQASSSNDAFCPRSKVPSHSRLRTSPPSEHASSLLSSLPRPPQFPDRRSFQIDEQTAMNYETRNLAGLPRNLETDRRFHVASVSRTDPPEVDHFDHERRDRRVYEEERLYFVPMSFFRDELIRNYSWSKNVFSVLNKCY